MNLQEQASGHSAFMQEDAIFLIKGQLELNN